MSLFSTVTLVLVALPCSVVTSYSVTQQLYHYTVSVIEYLYTHHNGVFTCIFYDKYPDYPQENILELLLWSPQLNHIPKYTIDGSLPKVRYGYFMDSPTLILYRAGNSHWTFDQQMFETLDLFHQNTKMLVFIDCTRTEYFEANSAVLTELLRFNKVVYLCTTQLTVARTERDWEIVTALSYYPALEDLFHDTVRNLRGERITYTWREVQNPVEDVVLDPAAMWIQETARYLNGTCAPMLCPCELKVSVPFGECYWKFLKSCKIDFTIDGITARAQVHGNFRLIYSTVPFSDRLIVPNGRLLKIVELFFVPFTWSAWLLIVIILVVTELFSIAKPNLFRNDPIMMVVCSFERYNLHRAGRFEKFVLQSLITTFFFVLSAYEVKIIALMTAKPSLHGPKTFEDLVKYGVPIKADLRKEPALLNNTLIGPLVVHSILNIMDLDGTSAYKAEYNWMEFKKSIPSVGSYLQKRRYSALNQILGIRVLGFYTSYRSPFLEQFGRTLALFEETGITTHWQTMVLLRVLRHPVYNSRNIVFPGVLPYKLEDLMLVWILLAVGLVAGMIIFISELTFNHFKIKMLICLGISKKYFKILLSLMNKK